MADLELVEGEGGDAYDITVKDKDGNVIDLTALGITAITLFIAEDDKFDIPTKTITGITVQGVGNEIARWDIAIAEIPSAGHYFAMLKMTGAGGLVRKTRPPMTVHVQETLGT